MRSLTLPVLPIILLIAGCGGGGTETAPSPYAGSYSATLRDDASGDAQDYSPLIVSSGGDVQGQYTDPEVGTVTLRAKITRTGTLNGTLSAPSLGTARLTGTLSSTADGFSGPLALVFNGETTTGTLTATRPDNSVECPHALAGALAGDKDHLDPCLRDCLELDGEVQFGVQARDHLEHAHLAPDVEVDVRAPGHHFLCIGIDVRFGNILDESGKLSVVVAATPFRTLAIVAQDVSKGRDGPLRVEGQASVGGGRRRGCRRASERVGRLSKARIGSCECSMTWFAIA